MEPVTANISLRPVRLGFLVDPRSRKVVQDVMRMATTMWGGMMSPLIPVMKRMPAEWTDKSMLQRPQQVSRGYAPALTVDETETERPLYKLIYLSRHPVGLRVFRDAHVKALEAQATYKSARKAETRRQKTGMNDLFASPSSIDPAERSALEIASGGIAARALMIEILRDKPAGLQWKDIWARVLDACVVTHNQLGDCVRDLRDSANLTVPAWTSAAVKRPKDEYLIQLA